MHPGVLVAGIGALDAVIAGQAVYALRRSDREAGKGVTRVPPHKREGDR